MTDTGRKADERTMGPDQTPVNLAPVDETPLRSRQSTSCSTVYRTMNLIKEHMSEFPRTYADIVDKMRTSRTPKRHAELERRGLNESSTMRTKPNQSMRESS